MKMFALTTLGVVCSLSTLTVTARADHKHLPVPVLTQQLCRQARDFCYLADQLYHAPGGDAFQHYSRQVSAHVNTLENMVRQPQQYHAMRHVINDLEAILDDAHALARDLARRHRHARYAPGIRLGGRGFHVVIGAQRPVISEKTFTQLCSLTDVMDHTIDDLDEAIRRHRRHDQFRRHQHRPGPVIIQPAPHPRGPVLRGPQPQAPQPLYPSGQRNKPGRSSGIAFQINF